MKSSKISLLVLAGGALAAALGMAQPAGEKAKPDHAQPPAPDAQMQQMMEAWAKSATPGDMHKTLTATVGEWKGKVHMCMAPGAPMTESDCTTTIHAMFGGRFTRSETKGMMNMGEGQSMPFEGFGLFGYNNTTQKFEGVWVDNMGTMMMFYTGELAKDGKSHVWNSKFIDPITGKDSWMRETETITGPDTMTLEMWGPMPDGTGEFKMMSIDYTRAAHSDKPAHHMSEPKKADEPKADHSK